MPVERQELRNNTLIFSLFFLLFFGAMGIIQPYITLYFHDIGFTGKQISALMVVSSITLIVVAPQFGLLFDYSRNKQKVFTLSLLVITLTLASIPNLRAFVPVLILWIIHRSINSSAIPAAENLSYHVGAAAHEEKKSGFGAIRLWGSIGFAVVALVGGWIYQEFGINVNNFIFIGMMVVVVLVFQLMPASIFKGNVNPAQAETRLNFKGILRLITSDRFLWLTVIALALTDPLQDGVRSFETIFMKDLGLAEATIGLTVTLSALGEVPFMIWADRLISKLGIHRIVVFVILFDLVRRLTVWFFPLPEVVFVTSVLTSVSFTFRLVGTLSLVNLRVPRQYTTTANSFISVTMYGLGHIFSNAVSGLIFDLHGGRYLYLLAAFLGLVAFGLAMAAGNDRGEPATPASFAS